MTKKAPTVASTRMTNTAVAARVLSARSAVIADLHEHAVRERPLGVELVWPPSRQSAPDRAAVADDERGQRPFRDVSEGGFDAGGVLLERPPAGEAEATAVLLDRERPRPGARVLALDVGDQAALPLAAPGLREALVHDRLEAYGGADDLGGLARAAELARVERLEAERRHLLRERACLLAAALVERLVDRALHAP